MEVRETAQMTGVIKIGEQIVAQANAVISSETGTATSYQESINDYDLYISNKESCRQQFDEFQLAVRAKEDYMQRVYHTAVEEGAPEEPVVDQEPEKTEEEQA